jgi:hypothetical protein
MSNMLDVMMKLKGARNLGARQAALVDSAYFAVRSAGRAAPRKARPPVHEYVRHLVYNVLAQGEVNKVCLLCAALLPLPLCCAANVLLWCRDVLDVPVMCCAALMYCARLGRHGAT